MAEVLDIGAKAQVTYGQNQAYWHQNVIDAFSNFLPELAYGYMTPAQFCAKLSEAAARN
jgi:raffinose/stachyose/melibiose transport system substrate-binding protein